MSTTASGIGCWEAGGVEDDAFQVHFLDLEGEEVANLTVGAEEGRVVRRKWLGEVGVGGSTDWFGWRKLAYVVVVDDDAGPWGKDVYRGLVRRYD